MFGSYTGDYICGLFLDMMGDWGIDLDRVVLVLRDSGANMIRGMRLAEIPDLSCSAHLLQLVVNEGINSQRAVRDIISKLKTCATDFSHSVLAKQRLMAIQEDLGLPQHGIIQAVPTRWNSTLHMLQRMLEQKRAPSVYSGEHGKFASLSAEQWDIISNLVNKLGPIEEVTLEMSKAEACMSCIIPSIAVLKMLLQAEGPTARGIKTFRETMLQSLEKRFSKIEETKCLVLATLLDPRYKGHVFAAEGTMDKAKQWLKEEQAVTCDSDKQVTTEDQRSESKRMRVEEKKPSGLVDQMFANILGTHSHPKEDREDISDELNRYLREPVIDRKTGQPLEWWKQNSTRLSLLAPLARKYLCPPPSSVPSEIIFSEIGTIYEKKWNRLTGENAEKLCFLHYSLLLLDWDY
ncbi:hypothetical protein SRHO_G00043810 [Serrasalmus rhombeus]